MSINQIREVAGQAVGYAALFILGTPITFTYHAKFGIAAIDEKLTNVRTKFNHSYYQEKDQGASGVSSTLVGLESAVKEIFPNIAKGYEDYCISIERERMNKAIEFHNGSSN